MTNADTWIGLNDQSEEGNWDNWNSGAPVTYNNWKPGLGLGLFTRGLRHGRLGVVERLLLHCQSFPYLCKTGNFGNGKL